MNNLSNTKQDVVNAVNKYFFHFLYTTPSLASALYSHCSSVNEASIILQSDADFEALPVYHPNLNELGSYFVYWFSKNGSTQYVVKFYSQENMTKMETKVRNKLMPSFQNWFLAQSNVPSNVKSIYNFMLNHQDDKHYRWKDQLFESTMRHFKDFLLAFMDGQFVGSIPNSTVNEMEHALCMFPETEDLSSYFPKLTRLMAYFATWYSNEKKTSYGRKNIFTIQFPHWLQNQANVNDDTLQMCKLFCDQYPNREIIKGRNYNYWNYNV